VPEESFTSGNNLKEGGLRRTAMVTWTGVKLGVAEGNYPQRPESIS
jgi:hypothetical protein